MKLGGMHVKSDHYWQLFLTTGSPEAYLLYSRALKMEEGDVFNCTGDRPESNSIQ